MKRRSTFPSSFLEVVMGWESKSRFSGFGSAPAANGGEMGLRLFFIFCKFWVPQFGFSPKLCHYLLRKSYIWLSPSSQNLWGLQMKMNLFWLTNLINLILLTKMTHQKNITFYEFIEKIVFSMYYWYLIFILSGIHLILIRYYFEVT